MREGERRREREGGWRALPPFFSFFSVSETFSVKKEVMLSPGEEYYAECE